MQLQLVTPTKYRSSYSTASDSRGGRLHMLRFLIFLCRRPVVREIYLYYIRKNNFLSRKNIVALLVVHCLQATAQLKPSIQIFALLFTLLWRFSIFTFQTDTDVDTNTNKTDCSSTKYSGSVCLAELQQWHYCDESSGPDVLIPSDLDQNIVEKEAQQMLTYFRLLNPSKDCLTAFRSFICLYLFGLCDSRGHIIQPSYNECIHLTTDTCVEEVKEITTLLGPERLPQCQDFSHNHILCSKLVSNLLRNIS